MQLASVPKLLTCSGTRLSVTARTVDLFPTILDLAGVTTPPELQLSGRSLAGSASGPGRAGGGSVLCRDVDPATAFRVERSEVSAKGALEVYRGAAAGTLRLGAGSHGDAQRGDVGAVANQGPPCGVGAHSRAGTLSVGIRASARRRASRASREAGRARLCGGCFGDGIHRGRSQGQDRRVSRG